MKKVLIFLLLLILGHVPISSLVFANANQVDLGEQLVLYKRITACDIFCDDSTIEDISWTNIICNANNTIDQNIEARYGSLRHVVADAKLGLGLESTKNMQTFCNAIADSLNASNVTFVRKLLYLTGKATKAVTKSQSTVEDLTLEMSEMLYNYSHDTFIGSRNRLPQYAFLVRFLDLMKESKGKMPNEFKKLLAAYLKSDIKQVNKIISSTISDSEISKMFTFCEQTKNKYFSYRDKCLVDIDNLKSEEAINNVLNACDLAEIAYPLHEDPNELLLNAYLRIDISFKKGNIYMSKKQYDKSMESFKKVLDIYNNLRHKKDNVDYMYMWITYMRIAEISKDTGDYKNVIDMGDKMIKICAKISDGPGINTNRCYAYAYAWRSDGYYKLGQMELAEQDRLRARDFAIKCGEECKNIIE